MSDYLDTSDTDIITPDVLARKLLFDNEIANYSCILLPFIINNENTDTSDDIYNKHAGQFELLITLYMEMVYGLLMINHINEHINDNGEIDNTIDLDETFNPNLTEYDISDLTDIFREKFKKIRIFLSVTEIFDYNCDVISDYGSANNYYCKIILKDTIDGKHYFNKNNGNIEPKKHYTFLIRNDMTKNQNKLNDFYAVCSLPNKKVKIYFSIIE